MPMNLPPRRRAPWTLWDWFLAFLTVCAVAACLERLSGL